MEMKKLAQIIPFFILGLAISAQQPQTQTAPIYPVNAKYANGVAPGYAPTAGSGLTLDLGGGTANCGGTIVTYAAGTLTMTASSTNYVYLDTTASCAPAVKTTTFTSSDIPIAVVIAGTSAITSITDDRTMFQQPGSGAQINPANQITWPTGAAGCVYAPGTNTCVPNGASGGSLQWQRQGIVIAPTLDDPSPQVQETSAVWGVPEFGGFSAYSQVVKFAFGSGWFPNENICFAESADGLQAPVRLGTCITGHSRSWLMKSGSTYILYASNNSTHALDIYTGSTLLGLTLAHTGVLSCGANGNETAGSLGNISVWVTGGSGTNWNMLYDCVDSTGGGSYADWLATSTDSGATWTKASTAPKIGTSSSASSASCFDVSDPDVVVLSSTNLRAYAHCGPTGVVPTPYIWSFTSTDNGVTWALDAAPTLEQQTADEGFGRTDGQIAGAFLLDGGASNKTILYYNGYASGCAGSSACGTRVNLKAAILPQPLSTVAASTTTDGGVVRSIPVAQVNNVAASGEAGRYNYKGTSGVNVTDAQNGTVLFTAGTTASDNFNRAAGALGVNWTGNANVTIQSPGLVGDIVAGATNDFDWYTGAGTFTANQCSYVTLATLPGTGSWIGASVRETTTGDMYALLVFNTSSSVASFSIYKAVGGTFTLLGSPVSSTGTVSVGEVYGLCASGTTLKSYRNGAVVGTQTDSTFASGYPGIGLPSNSTGRIGFWLGVSDPAAITALTGDGTATGPGSAPFTLATVNSGSGSCGDATHVCAITTNPKGLVTFQSAVAITGTGGGFPTPVTLNASSSTSLDFTTCISSSYRDYELRFSDIVPATASADVVVEVSTDGGSTWDTTAGHYVFGRMYVGITQSGLSLAGQTNSSSATGFSLLSAAGGNTTKFDGTMRLYNLLNSTAHKAASFDLLVDDATSGTNMQKYGYTYKQTAAVNALRVIATTGNITSGTVVCQPLPQ